jgi:hypothetical protein
VDILLVVFSWWLLMAINGYFIGGFSGYFINVYSIGGYLWLFY